MKIKTMQIETYEDAISAGLELAQSLSENKWNLGDLACLVCSGQLGIDNQIKTVSSLATHINVSRRSLSRYKVVASFFTPEVRKDFKNTLSFTHFVHAYQNCSGSMSRALSQLEIAAERSYSCEKFLAHLLQEEEEIEPESEDLAPDATLQREAYDGLKHAKKRYVEDMSAWDNSKDWQAIGQEMDRILDLAKSLIFD